jgi:hypothetical protein
MWSGHHLKQVGVPDERDNQLDGLARAGVQDVHLVDKQFRGAQVKARNHATSSSSLRERSVSSPSPFA